MFVMRELRRSLQNRDELILQGWCDGDFIGGGQVVCLLKKGGKGRELPVRYQTDHLSPLEYYIGTKTCLSELMTFFISWKEDDRKEFFRHGGRMILRIEDSQGEGDKSKILANLTARRLAESVARIPHHLDRVEREQGGIVISGWAADISPVSVRILDSAGQDLTRDSAVKKTVQERPDVLRWVKEGTEEKEIGFTFHISEPAASRKLRLELARGENHEILPLRVQESQGNSGSSVPSDFRKVAANLRTVGFRKTCGKIWNRLLGRHNQRYSQVDYEFWRKKNLPTEQDLEAQKKKAEKFIYQPVFSILVPLYETNEKMLKQLLDSVEAQTYPRWELVFSDGSHDPARLRKFLTPWLERDDRITFTAEKKGPLGISENTNQAMEKASGDFIVLGDHDDFFAPDALYSCAEVLNRKIRDLRHLVISSGDTLKEEREDRFGGEMDGTTAPMADEASAGTVLDLIYTDEDKCDESGEKFFDPNMKPDFSPDFLNSVNYICHMLVVRRTLAVKIGGFRKEFDGAQDYDFIFRVSEEARAIEHIPKVLYHWRSSSQSTSMHPEAKAYAFQAGQRAIEEHLKRMGKKAAVTAGEDAGYYDVHYEIENSPLVSVLIPSKDHSEDLKTCLRSMREKSTYRNLEYIIIENNSTEDTTFSFYEELKKYPDVKIITYQGDFNFSKINNFGRKEARGEYLLLLNNDTEMMSPDAIRDMLGFCQQSETGAVGARLYYQDGTLQHAGVVVGFGGVAGHCFTGQRELPGEIYFNRSKMTCDYSAVTAACLMVKSRVFDEVGGLDPDFKVAFNDIDFCLRIREKGYRIIYDAASTWHHYESKSRGLENTPEKEARFRRETALFQDRWKEILAEGDPYYNPNLSLIRQDFSLKI